MKNNPDLLVFNQPQARFITKQSKPPFVSIFQQHNLLLFVFSSINSGVIESCFLRVMAKKAYSIVSRVNYIKTKIRTEIEDSKKKAISKLPP